MCSQLCMVPFIRLGYGSWMIFIRWKDTFEARLTHSHTHFISEWCKQKVPLIKFSVSHLSTFQNCVLLYLYHPKTLAGIKYLFEVNIWSLFVRSNQMHLNILATLQRLKKTCLKRQFILSLVYKLWRLESNISDARQNQTAVGLPATQERKNTVWWHLLCTAMAEQMAHYGSESAVLPHRARCLCFPGIWYGLCWGYLLLLQGKNYCWTHGPG